MIHYKRFYENNNLDSLVGHEAVLGPEEGWLYPLASDNIETVVTIYDNRDNILYSGPVSSFTISTQNNYNIVRDSKGYITNKLQLKPVRYMSLVIDKELVR